MPALTFTVSVAALPLAVASSGLISILRSLDSGAVAGRAPRIGTYQIAPPVPALPMTSTAVDVRFEGDVYACGAGRYARIC